MHDPRHAVFTRCVGALASVLVCAGCAGTVLDAVVIKQHLGQRAAKFMVGKARPKNRGEHCYRK